MFRKLVSSLPFSPALVGQLGFYARRLNREQAVRRLGLIFTVLAVIVQSFALISPPEPTYAVSPSNDCAYSSTLTKSDPACRACPYNADVWVNDPACNKNLKLSIEAINLSQGGKNIVGSAVSAGDRIQYTIRTTNTGAAKVSTPIEISVRDLVDYTTPTDMGGGIYDQQTQKVSWGSVLIASKQTDVRSFVMSLNDPLPMTPQATDSPTSYDCLLTITYGNTLNNVVNCPASKGIEGSIKQLPQTGAGQNIAFSVILVAAVAYFYLRTRQLNREIKVIRHDLNVG